MELHTGPRDNGSRSLPGAGVALSRGPGKIFSFRRMRVLGTLSGRRGALGPGLGRFRISGNVRGACMVHYRAPRVPSGVSDLSPSALVHSDVNF